MSTENLLIEQSDSILTLTFNRPKRKNALTLEMYTKAANALKEARDNEEIRVVVLRGAGGSFTSGNDLHDFAENPPVDMDSPVFHFLIELRSFPKPVVAGVQGYAVGIGTTMLLHCDLVFADTTARFQLPFINLALVPEAASSFILPRLMGYVKAAELLMLGDKFGADDAVGYGIVNSICEEGALDELVRSKAEALAAKPPEAMRLTKALMKAPWQEQSNEVMKEEGKVFAERLQSPEFMAAVARFFKK